MLWFLCIITLLTNPRPLNNGPLLFPFIQGVIQSDGLTSHSSAGIHVVWIWEAHGLPSTVPVEHQMSAFLTEHFSNWSRSPWILLLPCKEFSTFIPPTLQSYFPMCCLPQIQQNFSHFSNFRPCRKEIKSSGTNLYGLWDTLSQIPPEAFFSALGIRPI